MTKPFSTGVLANPSYNELLRPAQMGSRVSSTTQVLPVTPSLNYQLASETLERPNYKDLFAIHESGVLVRLHVFQK